MEGFIGQIALVAINFAPRNWAFCNGQLLPIAQNTALFSILGTTYGGDGRTTFGLPNLQGRGALHPGRGPGLNQIRLGQSGGATRHTLLQQQLPGHTHTGQLLVGEGAGTQLDGNDAYLANAPTGGSIFASGGDASATGTSQVTIGNSAGGQPLETAEPSLAMYYCICLFGVYPSRS